MPHNVGCSVFSSMNMKFTSTFSLLKKTIIFVCCFTAILVFYKDITYENNPTLVNSSVGVIEGFEYYNRDGSKSHIYLGIPYARAPAGELRFMKPMPYSKQDHKIEAKKFGPACYPVHKSNMQLLNHSEDCLYLNIMKPAKKSSNPNGFPVLVFIHGGGFVTGDAEQFGYKSLSENFAAFGIIAVSIQYRIGPLGFFSTGDDVMPGNIGLWDQAFALQFLHQILPSFGGNVQEIIVWGSSAGAASVHALSLSPHSQNLFKRAIQSSGSLFSAWAFNENVVDHSLRLARHLNCSQNNSHNIQVCMKTITLNEILEATDKMGAYNSHIFPFKFNPRFDGDFFPRSLKSLMNSSKKIPTLFGLAEKEWAIVVNAPDHPLQKIQTYKGLRSFIKNLTDQNEDKIEEKSLLRALYRYFIDENGTLMIKNKIKNWHLNQIVNIISDLMFIVPVIQQIKATEALKQENYLFYQKHYHKDFNWSVPGAVHGNEMKYIFPQEFPPLNFSKNDKIFQKNLLDGFRSFILTGKPKSSGIQWPTAGNHGIRHIVLNPDPSVEKTFENERMQFWMSKLSAQVGKNVVRQMILPQTV